MGKRMEMLVTGQIWINLFNLVIETQTTNSKPAAADMEKN